MAMKLSLAARQVLANELENEIKERRDQREKDQRKAKGRRAAKAKPKESERG